ncbi:hypothetical protein BC629DRAFT_1439658 [Irpex lacteus]|nr:hypothetical protein BC629DRAFT_1439658 [Irpex lacteus]
MHGPHRSPHPTIYYPFFTSSAIRRFPKSLLKTPSSSFVSSSSPPPRRQVCAEVVVFGTVAHLCGGGSQSYRALRPSNMSQSTLTRYPPFARDASHAASTPIPIPHVRRVTDPPPRSPTRYQASSDLIFEMSPHVVNETPLTARSPPTVFGDTNVGFSEKSSLPTVASRFGYARRPNVNVQPYAEEPFLYSIPRFPTRSPLHSRTQSAVVYGAKHDNVKEDRRISGFPDSFAIKALTSVHAQSVHCSDTSNSDHEPDDVLTTAFQQSFTSKSSSVRSSIYSSVACFDYPISPPASIRDEKASRSIRIPTILRKKSNTKTTAIPAAMRTSAAEPVVSFAQAELKQSPSSGMIARVVRASKASSRARSPYPAPVRGRRDSLLRPRSSKVSDDDLAGTLENSGLSEKPGFERFLPSAFTRRRAVDENEFTDDLVERGRARSRTRPGRRL